MNGIAGSIRLAVLTTGCGLAAFHAYLFGAQVLGGQLADPTLALRWVVAAVLLSALVVLRRRGEALLGRRAVAVWLLVAVLHGPALTTRHLDAPTTPWLPAVVETMLQVGLAGAGLGLLLLGAIAAHRLVMPFAILGAPSGPLALGRALTGFSLAFAPRPPPSR